MQTFAAYPGGSIPRALATGVDYVDDGEGRDPALARNICRFRRSVGAGPPFS